jgi:glycogen operon protein
MTVFLNGDALTYPGPHGEPVRDDSFLVMLSADREALEFTVPGKRFGTRWAIVLDTADDGSAGQPGTADSLRPGDRLQRTGGSMIVLRRTAPS